MAFHAKLILTKATKDSDIGGGCIHFPEFVSTGEQCKEAEEKSKETKKKRRDGHGEEELVSRCLRLTAGKKVERNSLRHGRRNTRREFIGNRAAFIEDMLWRSLGSTQTKQTTKRKSTRPEPGNK